MGKLLSAVVRFSAGIAGLAVLLAGVPLVLAHAAGWPLPRTLPAWDDVRTALGGSSVSDETIVKAVAVVGWLAWVQVLASTIVEATAWARGRAAARVPLAGPIQPLVRHLLLSVLVVAGTARSVAVMMSAGPAPALAVAVRYPVSEPCTPERPQPPEAQPAPETAPHLTYTVRPRDSLWKLAERHLGDGLRWRELWELNRDLPQPDGRSLRDPDLLRPGWLLRLPPDAVDLDGVEAVPPPPVVSPDHPPDLASRAPAPAPPPVSTDRAPDLATPAASPTTLPGGPASSPSPPATALDHAGPSAGQGPDHGDDRGAVAPRQVGIAGAGLLAAGIVATITKLRRAQVRRRRPGHTIPTPRGDAAAEAALRAVSTLGRAERLDLALRALAACLASRRESCLPPIQAVLAGVDVEVLFTGPVAADPGPFLVDAGGRAWTQPGAADAARVEMLARGMAAPAPCLVPVGRIDDRDLLIDLEACAATAITGDRDEVDTVLWAIAAGLATSQWADDVRVVVVGDVAPGFERLERIEPSRAVDAVDRVRAEVSATRVELSEARAGSTLEARVAGGSWTPTVVLLSRETDAAAAGALAELAASGTGMAVVISGDAVRVDRRVAVKDGVVTVTPPGIIAALPDLPARLRRSIGEVVDLAVPDEARETPPVIDLTAVTDEPPARAPAPDGGDQMRQAAGTLLVRVLGPVGIDGGGVIERRKSEELVVYLALHRDGVDEQRLKTALWPEGGTSPHAFNQAASRARICLGTAPDGSHYLPRRRGGMYRVGEWVTSDVDRLALALRDARVETTPETVERLAAALRLVRGQPFEGVKSGYEWAHSEGFASRFEILAGEAAHLVAEWHLDHGEATAALWAAGQGLLASPADEVLYRDRMRAYALAGNRAAVESVMRELCRVVEALEPYDSLHPETVELYESLVRRRVG
jgi:DNA-binding SARP family transcriptional activator